MEPEVLIQNMPEIKNEIKTKKIGIIGLGYVGLPLAVEFAKKYATVGFDINQQRVDDLNAGTDHTLEVEDHLLQSVLLVPKHHNTKIPQHQTVGLKITTSKADIADCNVYIITVPTPVDKHNRPDLTPLYRASETAGSVLKKGDIVI